MAIVAGLALLALLHFFGLRTEAASPSLASVAVGGASGTHQPPSPPEWTAQWYAEPYRAAALSDSARRKLVTSIAGKTFLIEGWVVKGIQVNGDVTLWLQTSLGPGDSPVLAAPGIAVELAPGSASVARKMAQPGAYVSLSARFRGWGTAPTEPAAPGAEPSSSAGTATPASPVDSTSAATATTPFFVAGKLLTGQDLASPPPP